MHRPKLAASDPRQSGGTAAIAKRRLVAAIAADRRAPAPARRPETQLLAQLLADTPSPPKRHS